jgi:major membrane immunogen (membrane-anchored lipoprotein)
MRGRGGYRVSWFCGAILLASLVTIGCGAARGAQYADGVYAGESGEDENGAYGEAELVLRDGRIAACSFVTHQKDGSIKDADYGKSNGEIANRDFYDKAQVAVTAMDAYARSLVEVQDLRAVDAISGATVSHSQFVEAVEAALRKAKK